MIDLDNVIDEYESGYAKAYKNLPDLVAELRAARKVVEAARVVIGISSQSNLIALFEAIKELESGENNEEPNK